MRGAVFGCGLLIGVCVCSSPALAKCPPGEVWGDVGCRPAAKPSIMVQAAKRLKKINVRRKRPAPASPETPQQ
jgi:hypothetical protein